MPCDGDEVKYGTAPDPFDPERPRLGDAELKQPQQQRKTPQAYTPPSPADLIQSAADSAMEFAQGLAHIEAAIYGTAPGPRERAEKVLVEFLHCYGTVRYGRIGKPY